MPEANVLYGVTAVVVLGLVAWVAIVLKTAKEPWARSLPQLATPGIHAGFREDDVPLETPEESAMTSEGGPITAEKVAAAEDAEDAEADESEKAKKAGEA